MLKYRSRSQYMSPDFEEQFLMPFIRKATRNGATRVKYVAEIMRLCDVLSSSFEDIDKPMLDSYIFSLRESVASGALTEGTARVRLCIFERFADYLAENIEGYTSPFSSFVGFKVSDRVSPASLPSVSVIDRLLLAAKDRRDYFLIISLAFRCALSTSQIVSLTIGSISASHDGRMVLRIPTHDPSEPVFSVYVPGDVAELVNDYVSSLGVQDPSYHLFHSRLKKPLSERSVQNALRNLFDKAGVAYPYTLQDVRNMGLVLMVQAAGTGAVASYTGMTEDALTRYKHEADITSGEPLPPDLVCLRVVSD